MAASMHVKLWRLPCWSDMLPRRRGRWAFTISFHGLPIWLPRRSASAPSFSTSADIERSESVHRNDRSFKGFRWSGDGSFPNGPMTRTPSLCTGNRTVHSRNRTVPRDNGDFEMDRLSPSRRVRHSFPNDVTNTDEFVSNPLKVF